MNEYHIILFLFPIVFMIHEFEEIIGIKLWFDRNATWVSTTFPILSKKVLCLGQMSTSAFAIAVFEEFILISLVTILALLLQWNYGWIALFTVFTFHLFIHIIQWVVVRKYIPVIISSILLIPYILWGAKIVLSLFSPKTVLLCFIIALPISVLNLFFIHKLAFKYDDFQKGRELINRKL